MNTVFGTRVVLLLAVLLLSACASTQKLSEEDRKKIGVVSINNTVQKAPNMYYMGPGAAVFLLFGAVGGAALAASSTEPARVLKEFAEKNGIFIEKIVLQEVDAAMRQSGKGHVSDSGQAAKATMNMLVYHYGFTIPNGFSSKLVPVVAVKFEIVDATGRIIWSTNEDVSILRSPAEPMTLEAMHEDPRRIEQAWRSAAKRIAGNITRALGYNDGLPSQANTAGAQPQPAAGASASSAAAGTTVQLEDLKGLLEEEKEGR